MAKISKVLVEPSTEISRELPRNLVDTDAEIFEPARCYRTNDIYLQSLNDVWVSPDSVVYKQGRLLVDTLADQGQKLYYQTRHLAKLLFYPRVRLDDAKDYLLATDAWSVGHYHWLTETIPRLWSIRDRLHKYVLLLPDSGYLRKTGIQSLTLLGLTPADIVFMKTEHLLKVRNFHYVSRVAAPGQMHDRLMSEIRGAFLGGDTTPHKKIYFSRAGAGFRKIVNEEALVDCLKQYGFEVVYGESETLEQQVRLFGGCSALVGIHGAGLANCLFMPAGGKVVELVKREPNYGYWHLADSVGHDYYYYYGEPDSELSLIGRGCNLTIPVDDFEQRILEIIERRPSRKSMRRPDGQSGSTT